SALRRAGRPYQLSPKSLLQQTLVSSGTMTNRIDRLVQRNLVERRTDPHDGRGILVLMTELGRERVDAALSSLLDYERELLHSLTGAERERLAGLLRKLVLEDRKSTRLNSSHVKISYAVFCLKKKIEGLRFLVLYILM